MKKTIMLRLFLGLLILGGIFAMISLLSIKGDPKNAWLLGLSSLRFCMVIGVLLLIVVLITFFVRSWNNEDWSARQLEKFQKIIEYTWIYYGRVFISGLRVRSKYVDSSCER